MSDSPLLITAALPYANGPLHLGHMLEYVQADIWARYHKQCGRDTYFVCADDCHGTAVMLRAQAEGLSPEAWIAEMAVQRRVDFQDCAIAFDAYHNTHAPEVAHLAVRMFETMQEAGLIRVQAVEQLYDAQAGLFLADRYVKGVCPRCSAEDQYGDHCEHCGATYTAIALGSPRSVLSDTVPEKRVSEHFFLCLSDARCVDFLRDWTQEVLAEEHYRKMLEWLGRPGEASTLTDWDISRDQPYFGFEIPGAPGKYFYVWWDAPITYMAMTCLLPKGAPSFEAFWHRDSTAEVYHFIGKDIVYFHALFWPTLLKFSGYRLPSGLCVHGFLTINGEKMSKSRGTFITVRQYVSAGLSTEYLRYYLASKMSDTAADIDFSITDFVSKINADLVGKYGNIFSRSVGLLLRHYEGEVLSLGLSSALCTHIIDVAREVSEAYARRQGHQAVRLVMMLADQVNQFVDQHKPWLLAKQEEAKTQLHEVLSTVLSAFALLSALLRPVLPLTVAHIEREVFQLSPDRLSFSGMAQLVLNRVYTSAHLFQKLDLEAVQAALLTPTV